MDIESRASKISRFSNLEDTARNLLDAHQPFSAYQLLCNAGFHLPAGQVMPEDAGSWVCLAEALVELDRSQEALALLDRILEIQDTLQKSVKLSRACIRGLILKAQLQIRSGQIDLGILASIRAEKIALAFGGEFEDLAAWAQVWCAVGYAIKRCYSISEDYLHAALEAAPTNPRVLAGVARLRTELDQRLAARRTYQHLADLVDPWAKPYAGWGLAHISYLLGEFDQAEQLSYRVLESAPEMVLPLFVLAQTALARADLGKLNNVVEELEKRSPRAEMLALLKIELETLQRRLTVRQSEGNRTSEKQSTRARRLEAFPTLIQHQDTCGPAVVELILRYWVGSSGAPPSSEVIAEKIKYPQAGTPIYRMREFFHLYGFDTVRCQAGIPVLKQLIDAGLPIIIQQEYSNSSHVSVVIGYDEAAGVIELQDPMTHVVLSVSEEELNHLRENYLDAALVAYPRYAGHEHTLMRMQLFNDPVLETVDRVILDFDLSRFEQAVDLLESNVHRRPEHSLSWIMLLHALNEIWSEYLFSGDDSQAESVSAARQAFFVCLDRAARLHPQKEFILQFEGWGALHDRDYLRAKLAFHAAVERDPEDARSHACLAECLFNLHVSSRQQSGELALQHAWKSLQCDPTLPAANIWMARSLAALSAWERDEGVTYTYKTGLRNSDNGHTGSVITAAWHYARSAVALEPRNALAHLALAEVLDLMDKDNQALVLLKSPSITTGSALEEVNIALSLSPSFSDAILVKASLLVKNWSGSSEQRRLSAFVDKIIQAELSNLDRLRSERAETSKSNLRHMSVEPTARLFAARKVLVEIFLQEGSLKQAARQIDSLLEDFPKNSWGLGIRARIYCESLLERGLTLSSSGPINHNSEPIFDQVQSLYAPAIEAAKANMSLLEEYLHYQEIFNGSEGALGAFYEIIQNRDFSQQPFASIAPRYHFLHARLLTRAGEDQQSAHHYIMALNGAGGIQDNNELYEAISKIVEIIPAQDSLESILDTAFQSDFPSLEIRGRTLGLALLTQLPITADPADQELRMVFGRQLLSDALQKNPDDAQACLVLGHMAVSPADREALYRRALMIAPGWSQARAALADFLTETGRPDQALNFTSGYAREDGYSTSDRSKAELLAAHARALLGVGHFEDAIQVFNQAIDMENALRGEFIGGNTSQLLWLYIGRWQAELAGGQVTQSLKTSRKAIRLFSGYPDLEAGWYLRQATSLRKLGRYGDADQAVNKGRLYGLSELDVLRAGYETAQARRAFDESLEILESYLKVEQSINGAENGNNGRLGWADAERLRLLIQLGRKEEVEEFLENENLDAEGWGQAAWNLLLTDFGAQSDGLALLAANNALSLEPSNHAGLFTRAEALSSMGREDEAVAAWLALRDAHPEEHTAYEKLALRLAITGNLAQALQFADRAIELGAFCPFSWAARGVVHFFNNDPSEALEELQLAWNRSDLQQREKNQVFWHLLTLLKARTSKTKPGDQALLTLDGYKPFEARLLKAVHARLAEIN